jgi:hypothetical protein
MARWVRALTGIAMAATIALPFQAQAIGSTPVTVVNVAEVAKAIMAAQHPLTADIRCDNEGTKADHVCEGLVVVPPNQRWIIEYVSMLCYLNSAGPLKYMQLTANAGRGDTNFYLNVNDAVNREGLLRTSQSVRIDAAPGSPVLVEAERVDFGSSFYACFVRLSGQAIDVP